MQAWEDFLRSLEQELGSSTVNQWLKSLKVSRFDAGNLYLLAPDPLQIAWFEEHIRPRLANRFVNNNQRPIEVHLLSPSANAERKKAPESSFTIMPDRIDLEYTFENFIVSAENAVAHRLLLELQGPTFNPIYLFGPKGCGKTHLLSAQAAAFQKRGKKVFFVRAETFTSHVVQAIRLGQMQQFRGVYRDIDVLCVDDIDQLAKKNATQEEFFHTFNALHTTGKQIILTATLPPSQLSEIEQRLVSRFEWGISIAIGKGDIRAILEKKAALWKLSLSPEVLSFLADTFPANPLLAIQALSLRAKGISSLTPERVAALLRDLIASEESKALTPEKIIRAVASHYGVKPEDLLGKSQAREHALPRQVAMHQCRELLKLPYQGIGKIFDRDHSTVMNSVRLIQKAADEKDGPLLEALKSIRS